MQRLPKSAIPTSLAPMEGITGFPMRLWLTWASQPGRMTTPFLRVNRAQPERGLPLLFAPELFELRGAFEYELTPQFLSADPEAFLRAADFLGGIGVPAIELNCGCPCPTCIGKNAGSGILADPDTFGRTVETLASHLGEGRAAIKMRLGYSDDREFDNLLMHVANAPLARLTVHGRTRMNGYRGRARWAAIESAAQRALAPTWGSGDVTSAEVFREVTLKAPSVAGVMIGRGAIRNPWIFQELRDGVPVQIDFAALQNALLAFALVNEAATFFPDKLVSKLANGKLLDQCGVSADAWTRLAAALANLTFGFPIVWSPGRDLSDARVSPTSLARLRLLWTHLRTSLPETFASPRLMRAKTLAQFFAQLEDAAGDCWRFPVRHQPVWDSFFSGASCPEQPESVEDNTAVGLRISTN